MKPAAQSTTQAGSSISRSRSGLVCEARHPQKHHHHRGVHPHTTSRTKTNKKRDISTSFRKSPVPRPLVGHNSKLSHDEDDQQDQQQEPLLMLGIPPPAAPFSGAWGGADASLAGSVFLDAPAQPSSMIRPSFTEPVVAAAAAAFSMPQDLGLLSLDAGVSLSSSSSDDDVWAEGADPLAAFDRVLDSLLVAPAPFGTTKPAGSSASSSASLNLSSLLEEPAAAAASTSSSTAQVAGTSSRKSSSSSSRAARPQYAQSLAAAAAAPAVTVIHCENEYERELQAAAALQQLLVVKVESSQPLRQRVSSSDMRFQTHTGLPTQLNAYLPHNDLSQGFGYVNSAGGSGSSTSGSSNTADVLASMGVTLGAPAFSGSSSSSQGSSPMGPASSLFGSSSSGEPFSPVHAWYKQLAAQYAHSAAAAGRSSPLRFLSLRGNAARARAVCRRLGVSAPLAVVLVDPAAGGRRLQEVCGAKIEQELPNGLLYFGGVAASGVRPADQLTQLNTEADLEAVKSASPLSVVAFHVHAAPPCVRSYGRLHAVAQQHSPDAPGADASAAAAVAFGVMDVDVAAAGSAVSAALGLQQLPTYVIYRQGQEVARLSSSRDRKRLAEVVAQQLAAAGQEQ